MTGTTAVTGAPVAGRGAGDTGPVGGAEEDRVSAYAVVGGGELSFKN